MGRAKKKMKEEESLKKESKNINLTDSKRCTKAHQKHISVKKKKEREKREKSSFQEGIQKQSTK